LAEAQPTGAKRELDSGVSDLILDLGPRMMKKQARAALRRIERIGI
jgi:hypothetical protein